tara:strand:- start:1481 stop:1927 length:447 start_codon:yes stop_codon:yes gene_type:complete
MEILDVAVALLMDNPFGKITISGGEPLQQEKEVLRLIKSLKAKGPNSSDIIMFTGLSEYEIGATLWLQLRHSGLDALISGRYDREKPVRNRGLLSSSNQQVLLLSDKFSENELDSGTSQTEIIIEEDGQLGVSGFPDLNIINQMRREV